MERSEPLDRTSTANRRPELEGERDIIEHSGVLEDFYLSSTRTRAQNIGEFNDEDGSRISENRLEQPHHLDPTVIFKKVAQDDIQKLAPEQNITLFALRLAIIEKSASGIGTLSFIWASTIILGGFASNINPVDFIVIALILVTEGTRIFSRSRELEWQHLASKSKDSSQAQNTSHRRLKRSSSFLIRDITKRRARATVTPTVTPGEESSPSSSEPTFSHIRESKGINTSRSTVAHSQDDLERGLGSQENWIHQPTRHMASNKRVLLTFNQHPVEARTKQKTTQSAETENKFNAEADHGKIDQTSRSVDFDQSVSGTRPKYQDDVSANTTGKSPTEKFPTTVIGTVDVKNIKRTWSSEVVPILPGSCTFSMLSTRGVSAILYWTQITSAVICLALSCWRLWEQEYNPPSVTKDDTPVNLYTSVNIFYALAFTEALLYLLERLYWEYKINYEQLVETVSSKADLGKEHQEMMKQFFYEVYKKCIDGSVFDGLDMDIVEYSLTLLQSDNSHELLSGLRVLRKIVDRHDGFALDALRRIGAAPGVIERLVEMLSWRGSTHQAEEIRLEVAALICRTVRYGNKNCFRVAAVPGAMEGIVSLLNHKPTLDPFMTSERATTLRLDGLRILVAQARDPVSLRKIGGTRGLVPILVSFIAVTDVDAFRKMEGSELKTFKKVLRLLKMLAGARNATGLMLRPVIVRVVFGIASMRDILEFGDSHPQLQWLAIEILNNLTLDDDIRRAIGSTGGVIRNLIKLYSRPMDWSSIALAVSLSEKDKNAEKAVSKRAGDALNLLATMCKKNCLRMMDLQYENGEKIFIPTLISLLNESRDQTICAAKILRSFIEYGSYSQKREIAVCIERVMILVMGNTSQRMHEAVVGLASRILAVLDDATYNQVFECVDRTELAQKLLRNLEYNAQASSQFPRIRRHSTEFILFLVKRDTNFFLEFMRDGLLEKKLMLTLDSICEAEDFAIFSGAEGLTRHSITMEDLLLRSLQEIRNLEQGRDQTPPENTATYS